MNAVETIMRQLGMCRILMRELAEWQHELAEAVRETGCCVGCAHAARCRPPGYEYLRLEMVQGSVVRTGKHWWSAPGCDTPGVFPIRSELSSVREAGEPSELAREEGE